VHEIFGVGGIKGIAGCLLSQGEEKVPEMAVGLRLRGVGQVPQGRSEKLGKQVEKEVNMKNADLKNPMPGSSFKDWLNEGTFDLEKERGLRGWFDRNNGKGWVDCKASRKGKIVPCGREKAGRGTDRKYPACRPTLSACNSVGKRRKKDSKPISWKEKE
jgi:hypothetical protein